MRIGEGLRSKVKVKLVQSPAVTEVSPALRDTTGGPVGGGVGVGVDVGVT